MLGKNLIKAAAGNAAAGDYEISRSLRFNSADSAYLSRTPASAGNRKTWTWSGWVKRGKITTTNGRIFATEDVSNNQFLLRWDGSSGYDTILLEFRVGNAIRTSAVYRDPSAWYHIVVAVDTTQATSTNRIKLYVNGSQVTAFSTSTYPSQNAESAVNATQAHYIGTGYSEYLDGYMADIHFIDGQALTPSSFGETDAVTGVWKPKAYAGTYGTNGFHLEFADNSDVTATTLGKDTSGNGNNWTPNNFYVGPGSTNAEKAGIDSLVDSPTRYGDDTGAGGEVRGNYATLSPLVSGSNVVLSNGNLHAESGGTGGGTGRSAYSTIAADVSQKWYCEVLVGSGNVLVGIIKADNYSVNAYLGETSSGYGYYTTGLKFNNGSSSNYGDTFTTGDIIGIALDGGSLIFYKNGVSQGTAFSGLSGLYLIGFGSYSNIVDFNFGQRPFAYTAPSGFKALCTTNLPEPTVVQGDDHFTTTLYTGNDGVNTVTTGLDVATDGALMWFKNRSANVGNILIDPVRGYNKNLESNSTRADDTFSFITSTSSTGFTMNTGSSAVNGGVSAGGPFSYALWSWKANGAGSSNTAGSIPSTVSANTTAGISIVTYTGTGSNATFGHGLGVAPKMVIVRRRDAIQNWAVWHTGAGTDVLFLDATNAKAADSTWFQSTIPTSTVVSIGTALITNTNTGTYVAYCFAEVEGFSKFGSYTGNGSADGPFVYTGFRPAFVLVKLASGGSGSSNWSIFDTSRNTFNLSTQILAPNASGAEFTAADTQIDILSNGIKIRSTSFSFGINQSGVSYIFAAFAENPFKNALAR